MTENICRLNYGILKAINYKRSILKILENCSELKEKETVIFHIKTDIFYREQN